MLKGARAVLTLVSIFACAAAPRAVESRQVAQRKAEALSKVLGSPRLVVTDISLRPTDDALKIFIAYKNVGSGGLPPAHEMTAKPGYRVLIDNREIQHGVLFFPDAATEPGWEVPQNLGFFAGEIKCWKVSDQTSHSAWWIGSVITVVINENKALGMESHSMTVNLKQMALRFWYDIVVQSARLDKNSKSVTIDVRIDGQLGLVPSFHVGDHHNYGVEVKVKPGQHLYRLTQKVSWFNWRARNPFRLYVYTWTNMGTNPKDIDFRNNYRTFDFKPGQDF
jgi:hypothetical protein